MSNAKLYKYALAAEDIGEDNNLNRETITRLTLEMSSAIWSNKLTVRNKNTFGPITVNNNDSSEELIWVNVEDVNNWLRENDYPFNWIPSSTSENTVAKSFIGISSEDVAICFEGIHYDNKSKWAKALADPPKWLLTCLTIKGSRGKKRSAFWDPILIAITLNSKFNIPKRKLDPIFVALKDYTKEWQSRSDYMN